MPTAGHGIAGGEPHVEQKRSVGTGHGPPARIPGSMKALPLNIRLPRNSERSRPRNRDARSRHCGTSLSRRSVFRTPLPPPETARRRRATPIPQQIFRIPSAGSIRSVDSHRRRDRVPYLRDVRIGDGPPVGWLGLQAPFTVHAVEEQPEGLVSAHFDRAAAHPPVRPAPAHAGPGGSMADADGDDLTASIHQNPLDFRNRRWIDSREVGTDFLDGVLTHLLADHPAFRRYAKQHQTTLQVEHRTDGHRCLVAGTRRAVELDCFGFARRGYPGNPLSGHRISRLGRSCSSAKGQGSLVTIATVSTLTCTIFRIAAITSRGSSNQLLGSLVMPLCLSVLTR